jgi:ParB family transcriptional regulator, chromosome partitioning protein
MARRRLSPPSAAENVPHAEHFAPTPARLEVKAFAGSAPIARVAAEAAGAAALEEVAETLRRARESGRLVLDLPLDAIAADHLTRDRLPAEDEEAAALRESIRLHGQRTPIEVTPLTGALPYGLISGWRRLAALRALQAETREPRFATIQALVRRPETVADAYVAMVEENEIRVGLSQYERARVAALATARGVFETEKAALLALFATASRAKRSRIRAFLEIHHALDSVLRFPAHLPERLGLQLVEALRAGQGAAIVEMLAKADAATPEAEMEVLAQALAARPKRTAPPSPAPEEIRPGVKLQESLHGRTLTLKLTGEGVTPALAARIRAMLAKQDAD